MNARTSVLVIFVEAIIYLLLCNLHDCTFKFWKFFFSEKHFFTLIHYNTGFFSKHNAGIHLLQF